MGFPCDSKVLNFRVVPLSHPWHFSGDRLHMLLHHCDPDDGGHVYGRLDPGRGLEGGTLHAVHRGGSPHPTPFQHGPHRWMLEG